MLQTGLVDTSCNYNKTVYSKCCLLIQICCIHLYICIVTFVVNNHRSILIISLKKYYFIFIYNLFLFIRILILIIIWWTTIMLYWILYCCVITKLMDLFALTMCHFLQIALHKFSLKADSEIFLQVPKCWCLLSHHCRPACFTCLHEHPF